MSGGLILALPSKGRLKQEAEQLLARAGMPVEQADGRKYRGRIAGEDGVEVAFLAASEIARELAAGAVHLGITGEDLVRESLADADGRIALVAALGFGRADVVVAVPEAWIDVWTMEDLDDVAAGFKARHGRRLRVATKYWNLTQGFFETHGIALYRVVESVGATEGAPAAGAADAIVDITTTGSTLAANHLKVLEDGIVLKSEAHLALSRVAAWDAEANRAAARLLAGLARAGVAVSRTESAGMISPE
ncbi:MAG: ATP phosphoribosyltransferase [Rhizobiales bacterium]|nr:ATP phosphoribosyltransferase [Hyphomicrobiales bacterium]